MGETREQRLREFHEENATTVVGLREGTWLLREGARLSLDGRGGDPRGGARIFRRGRDAEDAPAGADLSGLL
jgi:dipeptidase E